MAKSRVQHLQNLFDRLEDFERPEGDNEGSAWNGPDIFPFLPPEAQEIVEEIEVLARDVIVRQVDYGVMASARGLSGVRKHGCQADYGPYQYDPNRNVGYIERHDRRIDLSDPRPDFDDDAD